MILTSPRFCFWRALPVLVLTLLGSAWMLGGAAAQDTVILKNGEKVEGRIVDESDTEVRVEVQIGTIKEQKVVPRANIEEIIRPQPDQVALEEVKALVPTPSMMPVDEYERRIRNGPQKFLLDFPDSIYKPQVEEVLETLTEEMVKVRGGSIKLEGEWIEPAERRTHEMNIDARIARLQMERNARAGAYQAALQEYERLKNEFGSSVAYAESIPTVQQLLQAYGRSLTRKLQDLKIQQQQQEGRLALLTEAQRQQYDAGVERERLRIQRIVEREKVVGVRWLTVDSNDEKALNAAIADVRAELTKVEGLDAAALGTRADALYAAETMVAEGRLEEAEAQMSTLSGKGRTTSKDPMIASLAARLTEAQEKRAKEEALAKRMETEAAKISERMAATTATPEGAAETEGDTMTAEQKLAALTNARATAAKTEAPAAKPEEKKAPAPRPEPKAAPVNRGGGIGFGTLMPIVAVLLLGATAGAYFLDKKKKEGGGGE